MTTISYSSISTSPTTSKSKSPLPIRDLPIDLLRHCLQHLSLFDVVVFDDAILNHEYRPVFLSALAGLELYEIDFYLTSGLIHWLISRKVLMRDIPLAIDNSNLIDLIEYSRFSLRSINLSHSRITGEVMISFLKECPQLTSINFRSCALLTDRGIQLLVGYKRNIRQLNLSGCTQLTVASLRTIADHCHHLQEINLSFLEFVNDAEVMNLVRLRPLLQKINLSSTNITSISLDAIIHTCPRLKSLIFTGCPQISNDATKLLVRSLFYRQIMSNDPSDQLQGLLQLGNAFANAPHLINEIISLDLIPRLLSFLTSGHSPEIQIEVCDILSVFPSLASVDYTRSGVELLAISGAIPLLLDLLSGSNADVIQHVSWVTSLCGRNPEYRALAISSYVFTKLLIFHETHPSRVDLYLSSLLNLCHSRPLPQSADLLPILPSLFTLLNGTIPSHYPNICRLLRIFVSSGKLMIEKILEMKFHQRLIFLLQQQMGRYEDRFVNEAFDFLELIVCKSDVLPFDATMTKDLFTILMSLLEATDLTLYCSSCSKYLLKILERSPCQTFNTLLSRGFITHLFYHLDTDTIKLLVNITKQGSVSEKASLIEQGILKYFIYATSRAPGELIDRILEAILVLLRTNPLQAAGTLNYEAVSQLLQQVSSRSEDQKIARLIDQILTEVS